MRNETNTPWRTLILFPALLATSFLALAQPARPEPKIYRDKVEPHWFSGNTKFWYRVDLADKKREFILVDAENGTRSRAFDHDRVAKSLGAKWGKDVDAERLPFDRIDFSSDGKKITLIGENAWSFDLAEYLPTEDKAERPEQSETPREERPQRRTRSRSATTWPDGKFDVLLRGHKLFLREG